MKKIASSSSVVLVHDLSLAHTKGQSQEIPPVVKMDHHYAGGRINAVAWSHNNVIVASGGDDG
jgi:hypothetical protein